MHINHKKIGIIAAILGIILFASAELLDLLFPPPAGEREQLQKAAIESEHYTEQYIRSKAKDYQKKFGALKSIKNVTCIRQYNTYQTLWDALHHTHGRTMSTCYAYVMFEHGDFSIKLIMNRPSDGSSPWYVQKYEMQDGLTECASASKGDSGC